MASPAPPRQSVLVVDDQPDALRLITDTLEAVGVTVLVATSGQAALDVLDHAIPDLVLMDAVMPGLGGFETTRRIKERPALAHVPVIFMTGLTDPEHVVEGFAAGAVDYVRKPVDVDELIARVRLHMQQARAARASAAGLDATGRVLIAVDLAGRLLWCTPVADRVLRAMDPGWHQAAGRLPAPVVAALDRLLPRLEVQGATAKIDLAEGSLELAVIARYGEDEVLVRLTTHNPRADAARLQERLALTEREAEVLLWISYGKSNADISEVLGISPRTVQKHLERIFEKLGVETRAAAAAIAIRSAGQ